MAPAAATVMKRSLRVTFSDQVRKKTCFPIGFFYKKIRSFLGWQRRGRDGPLPGHEHPQRVRGGDVAGKDGVLADQMEGIEGEQERGIASRSKNCVMCVIDANWFKRQANVFLHYNVCKCMCLT